jgi:predicted permease
MGALLIKISAFYGLLILGAVIKTKTPVHHLDRVGSYLVNYALPFVFFSAAIRIEDTSLFPVAGLSFISSLIIFGFIVLFKIGGKERIPLGTMSSWSNNAFLGMPLASLLFGKHGLEIASLWAAGSITFFALLNGLILGMEGNVNNGQARFRGVLRRFFFPPYIPAVMAGYLLGMNGFFRDEISLRISELLSIAIFSLSTIYVGCRLKVIREILESRIIKMALLFKHVAFPILVMLLLFLDVVFAGLFSSRDYKIIMTMTIMPVAINVVILFKENNFLQSQAALCVSISTLITAIISISLAIFGASLI